MKLSPNTSIPDSIKKVLALEASLKGHIAAVVNGYPELRTEKDDIVQEVMIALLKYPDKLENLQVEAYARTIARNICYDMVNRLRKAPTVNMESLPDTPDDPEELQGFTIEHAKLMGMALKELKPDCFQVLNLYYFEEGLSKDRLVAEQLRQKTDAVKQRRGRCQESLKDIITMNKKYSVLLYLIPPSKRR